MKTDSKFNGKLVEGAGGCKLFVETTGDPGNPPILFIHGFSACRLSWDGQFESDLADRFHLVRMDIRGHGLSDKPEDLAAYQDGKIWADDIAAVIRDLNLDRPVLCGWSYAGWILCDYVRHRGQDGIAGLSFVGAATEFGRDEAMALLGPDLLERAEGMVSNDGGISSAAFQGFMDVLTFDDLDPHDFYLFLGFAAAVPPYARQGMFTREMNNEDILRDLTVPVLIQQGEEDRMVLKAAADNIARLVPSATKAYYPKCGHAPFFEVTDRFNQDLGAFVRQCQA
ncbi:MAG: alpha/beta hydrolase [SAR324 cluster bacterium]|nr:alpha/beta hydrolase [SAR324 cluster bacterium]